MKKFFNYNLISIVAFVAIFGFCSNNATAQFMSSDSSQNYAPYAHPVAMQNVGVQEYTSGQTTLFNAKPVATPTVEVAPTINSVYATPMRRVNEIPLYGKNKNLYFYGEKKPEDSPFRDSGLYIYAAYSTGKNKNGVNAERPIFDDDGIYVGGSDGHSTMGTATGFTLGFGREMSDSLSVEFSYSKYTGMKYGDYAYYMDEEPGEDEDGEEITIKTLNDNTFEIINGGDISSSFIGVGLKYNLDKYVGTLGGRLKPYIALSVGIVENEIKDYTIANPGDETVGDIAPDEWEAPTEEEDPEYDGPENIDEYIADHTANTKDNPMEVTTQTDTELTFIGKSKRNFGYSAEVGLSLALGGSISLDLFYRLNRFGSVETSGNILTSYTEEYYDWFLPQNYDQEGIDSVAQECRDGIDGISYDPVVVAGENKNYTVCISPTDDADVQTITTKQKEKGDMNFYQYGLKLKYMF